MMEDEWPGIHGDAEKYAEVVVDDYSWFSLSSVELHIWTHKPGAMNIDVDCKGGDGYGFCHDQFLSSRSCWRFLSS